MVRLRVRVRVRLRVRVRVRLRVRVRVRLRVRVRMRVREQGRLHVLRREVACGGRAAVQITRAHRVAQAVEVCARHGLTWLGLGLGLG